MPRLTRGSIGCVCSAPWETRFPPIPRERTKAWYRYYLEVQNVPAVQQVHRDYLLLRDYTGLAALFLIGLGVAALFVITTWKVLAIYVGILILQFVCVSAWNKDPVFGVIGVQSGPPH
jgi:hypothetical protein